MVWNDRLLYGQSHIAHTLALPYYLAPMMDESPTQIVKLVIRIFYATAQVQCSNGNSFIYVNVDVYTWHSHFV